MFWNPVYFCEWSVSIRTAVPPSEERGGAKCDVHKEALLSFIIVCEFEGHLSLCVCVCCVVVSIDGTAYYRQYCQLQNVYHTY